MNNRILLTQLSHIVNRHLPENVLPANRRFNLSLDDELYAPIAFAFVTEAMQRDIMDERATILAAMPGAWCERQEQLFARYDPASSRRSFSAVLALFEIPRRD